MAGKAKAAAKPAATTETAAEAGGLVFPGPLIPLAVLGAWMQGDWDDIAEKDGYFVYEKGVVVYVYHGGKGAFNNPEVKRYELGPLPDGWDCAELHQVMNDSGGLMVGRKEDISRALYLRSKRWEYDDQLGNMMHDH